MTAPATPTPGDDATPLDADVQRLLAELKGSGTGAGDVADRRHAHSAHVARFTPVPGRKPARVRRVRLPARDGAALDAAVYTPVRPASHTTPTIVWLHGGGWVTGGMDTADPAARRLADAGTTVVCVDYRRAPESVFPTAVQDSMDAMTWAAVHVADLGGDPAMLSVGGDSAGGNLAAVVAQDGMWRGGALAAQLLVYPMMDARLTTMAYPSRQRAAEHPTLTVAEIADDARLYLGSGSTADDPRVSPILTADVSGVAPAVIVTVGHDPLHDEGRAYARRLADAGVTVLTHDAPALAHGVVDLMGSVTAARRLFDEAVADLVRMLVPRSEGPADGPE